MERYLKIFSFIRVIELEAIMVDHKVRSLPSLPPSLTNSFSDLHKKADPSRRLAQTLLASEVTELIHGPLGLRQARAASTLFFTPPSSLDPSSFGGLLDALDARPDLSEPAREGDGLPSLLVRVKEGEVMGRGLEKICVASGLFGSKSTSLSLSLHSAPSLPG